MRFLLDRHQPLVAALFLVSACGGTGQRVTPVQPPRARLQADLCSKEPVAVAELEGIWEDPLDEWSLVRAEIDGKGNARVVSATCTHFLEGQHRLALVKGTVTVDPPAVVWPEEEWVEAAIECDAGRTYLVMRRGTDGSSAGEIRLRRRFSKEELWHRFITLPEPSERSEALTEWASWDLDDADLRAAIQRYEQEPSLDVRRSLGCLANRYLREGTRTPVYEAAMELAVSGVSDRDPEMRWAACIRLFDAARPPCDAPETPRNIRARTILEGVAARDTEEAIRCRVSGYLEKGRVPDGCPWLPSA